VAGTACWSPVRFSIQRKPPDMTESHPTPDRVLGEVSRLLKDLRFGSIEIQVHDGQVVAIERRERTRFAPGPRPSSER
jgi:hypothetical protein